MCYADETSVEKPANSFENLTPKRASLTGQGWLTQNNRQHILITLNI